MISKEQINEKLKQGWIQAAMMFEVVAITEEAATGALQNHIERMEKSGAIEMIKKEFSSAERIEKPIEEIASGFSLVCNTEFLVKKFESLVHLVLEFGPASVEILKPEKYQLSVNEAQNMLNTMAEMMHRFASAGLGGIVIARAGSRG